ncbi:MAG TPA: shikimate dehydrogenase [Lapillicoccus sp.]|nr:shikimate dehydrogenase [Lapillicoccus sp.]
MTFLRILTGSFSTPAADNPTVAVMEAAYRHADLDARYLNCEVSPAGLGDAVRGARAMGWAGFNCSIPHKVAILEYLDELAQSARIIGAVNCVVLAGGVMTGENTDGQGFVSALRTMRDPAGARVCVLGAGGAARAIVVETALAGATHMTVMARRVGEAETLTDLVRTHTPASADAVELAPSAAVPPETDILVNATQAGLSPDVEGMVDLDLETLVGVDLVADVVPNPPQTRLLREAHDRGCRTLDGLGMLVAQAAVNMELWTGIVADRRVMRRALEEALRI